MSGGDDGEGKAGDNNSSKDGDGNGDDDECSAVAEDKGGRGDGTGGGGSGGSDNDRCDGDERESDDGGQGFNSLRCDTQAPIDRHGQCSCTAVVWGTEQCTLQKVSCIAERISWYCRQPSPGRRHDTPVINNSGLWTPA